LTMQNLAAGKFLAPARNFTPRSARAPRGPLQQASKNLTDDFTMHTKITIPPLE